MSELFTSLAILACPVGMGVMTWFMMRGTNTAPAVAPASDTEPARMHAEIDELRAAERGGAASAR